MVFAGKKYRRGILHLTRSFAKPMLCATLTDHRTNFRPTILRHSKKSTQSIRIIV